MSSRGRRAATDADVRRGYIRGRDGTLKIEGLPLEKALELAKVSPPSKPAKLKPLRKPSKQIEVVPQWAVPNREGAKKCNHLSVGSPQSRSVLRPKITAEPKTLSISKSTPKPTQVSARKPMQKDVQRRSQKGQRNAKIRSSSFTEFDGQPQFEGGIRFVQGGLPELGKR